MLGSVGGAAAQPALGRVADVWGYSTSYVAAAAIELLAWPFLLLARRERAPSDPIPGAGPAAVVHDALAHGGAARPTRSASTRR
jgi:hypothetical protein